MDESVMVQALRLAPPPSASPSFLQRFCHPRYGGKWKITNQLGAYTPCFIDVVMVGLAHVALISLAVARFRLLKRGIAAPHRPFVVKVNLFFVALCAFVPLLQLADQLIAYCRNDQLLPQYEDVSRLIAFVGWTATTVVLWAEHYSASLKGWWYIRFGIVFVLMAEMSKVKFSYLFLFDYSGFLLVLHSTLFAVEYLAHVIVALLAIFFYPPAPELEQAEEPLTPPEPYHPLPGQAGIDQICPEYKSSFISRMTWSWVTPLMRTGGSRPLNDFDVWRLHPRDSSNESSKRFQAAMDEEKAREDPSLFRALRKVFGGRIVYAGLFQLVTMYTQYVPATYLGTLLASMAMGNPVYVSYRYAVYIFIATIVGSVCSNHYTYNMQRVGFRMRSALIAALFRKGLRLSYAGRQGFSAARIVGMISGQTGMFQFLCESLHSMWSTPTTLIVGTYLLWKLVGVSALASFAVYIIFVPIQMYVASTVPKLSGAGMAASGLRVGMTMEVFSHMDTVKCYGWEASFRKNINSNRSEEVTWARKALLLNGVNFFVLEIGPVLVAVTLFGTYTLLGGVFTSPQLFSSIALFATIKIPMSFFPEFLLNMIGAVGALGGVQELLLAEETALLPYPPVEDDKPAIECRGVSFSWDPRASPPTLQRIDLTIKPGQLVAIVGATGQGKTSLINALLGEMPISGSGKTPIIRGRVAYVPQSSWLFHSTVRNNILFGLPFSRVKYDRALRVSCMQRDMNVLPLGDRTEVYERGANLSGGQKQRLSIARAIYSNAETYIFDDPLSALDTQVTKDIFEGCIKKTLSGKTRVLVMNQLQFLPQVDHIVMLETGRIVAQGSFDYLMSESADFRDLVASAGTTDEEERQEAAAHKLEPMPANLSASDRWRRAMKATNAGKIWKSLKKPQERKEEEPPEKPPLMVEDEERGKGNVSPVVIKRYIKSMGGPLVLVLLLCTYLITEAMRIWGSLWMTAWAGSDGTHTTYYYIGGYAVISCLQILATLSAVLCLVFSALAAAVKLHAAMLDSVLSAPMSFFQTNPLGRLMNRFTKDIQTVDKMLATIMTVFLSSLFMVFSTFGLVGSLNTMSLWPLTPLFLLFVAIYLFFQRTARETERLDAVTWNPVFAQWSECLGGLGTLRPYRGHERMEFINGEAMDANVRYTLLSMASHRWLQLRLDCIGATMIFAIAAFIIMDTVGDQASKAPQLGLVLIYAFTITAVLPMVFKFASMAENMFNAVERVLQYADCPHEPPAIIENNRPPPGWPKEGAITFDHCVMRYRPDLPPALKDLSVHVGGGEKIGVVGRTGAGKSTIFNILFRLSELESGRVLIDNYDTAHFGVSDVRDGLMIIPQVPVVFTGSIRFNLDPFNEHEDAALWDALKRAHIKDIVSHLPLGLASEMVEGGHNFSVGQRQLLSLGRALLRRSKILVLDEATAALDRGTDALLQKTVRHEFAECTMLIIAHRLSTIIDSDKILVLDAGHAEEYGAPKELVEDKNGIFYNMVQSNGPANARYLTKIAKGEVKMTEVLDKSAALRKKTWKRALGGVAFQSSASKFSKKPVVNDIEVNEDEEDSPEKFEREDSIPQVSSSGDTRPSILEGLETAALTLQAALGGEQSKEIAIELEHSGIPEDKWWMSFLGQIDGLAEKGKKMRNRLNQKPAERMGTSSISWGAMQR